MELDSHETRSECKFHNILGSISKLDESSELDNRGAWSVRVLLLLYSVSQKKGNVRF